MRQIFVDSRDRVSGTSSNFSIVLPQTLVLESGHQGRIDDLRLPVTVPTIYFGNLGINVSMSGTPYDVYVDEGQMLTGEELRFAVYEALQGRAPTGSKPGKAGVPGSWTVTYDVRNTSMAISCSNAFQFTGGSFMKRLLERPFDYNGSGYNFYYRPLQGLDLIYLCCSNFSNLDNVGPKGASDCLCAIPITSPYGSVQAYSMSTDVYFNIPAITTQQLSFSLRDRDFNILNIVPNMAFTLVID
jgi:hypothetical protein